MASNKRIKGLSALTRSLLSSGEGDEVDFKKVPDGISQDDLVAFANSEAGGTILVGIVEQSVDGAQVGAVKGCDVSDATILQITNKAVTCIPPVSIEITIENLGSNPILRIAVPSSLTRPHCTARGVYNRRDGSRNRPLHPGELLRIFLENEGRVFAERFESAADRIAADLANLEATLDTSVKNMADQLGWAESKMDDTESKLDDLVDQVQDLERPIKIIGERMRTIFRQDSRQDPVADREIKKLTHRYTEQIRERPDLMELIKSGGSIKLREPAEISTELLREDALKALENATSIILRQEDLKKYAVSCKTPSECSDGEREEFYAVAGEGGVVPVELRRRTSSAFRLGFIRYEGRVVGTAALNKPRSQYRSKLFSGARSPDLPKVFPFELGLVQVLEEHQRKGQMTTLIHELMRYTGGKGLFAVAEESDTLMKDLLAQLDFKRSGEEFGVNRSVRGQLSLFILKRQPA